MGAGWNRINDFQDHFESRILIDYKNPSGCWIWDGSTDDGYGVFRIPVKFNTGQQKEKSHRQSYKFFRGEIPQGILVCHTCDVRNCVNPSHLFLGTAQENCDDKIKKGRQPLGVDRPAAKLSEDQVRSIRVFLASGLSERKIAAKFSVSRGVVRSISLGKTWKHLR